MLNRHRWPVESRLVAAYLRNSRGLIDPKFGGNGYFCNPPNDPITRDQQPYQARLRVFDENTGRLIREFWSHTDGTWECPWLSRAPGQSYLVVCYDGTYPALCWDHQIPAPMPNWTLPTP